MKPFLFSALLLAALAVSANADERMQVVNPASPVLSRPEPGAPVLGKVNAGDILFAQENRGDWIAVSPPEHIGVWLNTAFVEGAHVVAKSIQVRTGPGLEYDIVGSLSRGAPVLPIGEENGWCKISPPSSMTVWMRASDLRSVASPTAPIRAVETLPDPAAAEPRYAPQPPAPAPVSVASSPVPASIPEPSADIPAPKIAPANPDAAAPEHTPTPEPAATPAPKAPAPKVAPSNPNALAPAKPAPAPAPAPAQKPAPKPATKPAPVATSNPRPAPHAVAPSTPFAPSAPAPSPRAAPTAAPTSRPLPTRSSVHISTVATPVQKPAPVATPNPRPAPNAVAPSTPSVSSGLVADLNLDDEHPRQGRAVKVSGEVRNAPLARATPSKMQLIQREDSHPVRAAYLHAAPGVLRDCVAKQVEITGFEYWTVEAPNTPVVVVDSVRPLAP